MRKALFALGVPLVFALACSHEVRTRRMMEETTTTSMQPRPSERTVIVNEPPSTTRETIVVERPRPSSTYSERVYEESH